MVGKEPQTGQRLGTQGRKFNFMGTCRQYRIHVQKTSKRLFLCIKDYGSGSKLDFVHYEGKQSAYSSRLNKRD